MKNVHLSKIHTDRGWVWMGVQGRERHRAYRDLAGWTGLISPELHKRIPLMTLRCGE